MKWAILIVSAAVATGCMSSPRAGKPDPFVIVAGMTNDDVHWKQTAGGVEPTVTGESTKWLLAIGKPAVPALFLALADGDRFAAAHVLLTLITRKHFQVSETPWNQPESLDPGALWNQLVIQDIQPNGAGTSGPWQRADLALMWFKALGDPTLRTAIRGFKGWELYTWPEGLRWHYALTFGTNRNKTDEDIAHCPFRADSVHSLEQMLGLLAPGEDVVLSPRHAGGPFPPDDDLARLKSFCGRHHLQWDTVDENISK